ncbi:MAG TPA: hypothetical protein VHV51_03230 [Polyangiaceae bacterium]|jgi:hypothetical protein|nr:hypothetical protein [Polyangiaceae bacterium]
MTKHAVLLVSGLALLALAYAPSASAAAPSVPGALTQQGRLLDAAGNPVDGVALEFTFALYTAATGAANTAIWTEKQTITPDGGYFSARLGETTPFPATIFDGSRGTLFLGITIGTDTEMAPRQELSSVPFALLAGNALHANAADAASGGLDTRIASLETIAACPDAAARTNYGFCVWHEDNGSTYTLNYFQAASACKAKGGRLCSLAEASAAQAAGFAACAFSWVADRSDSANGSTVLIAQTTLAGCGNPGLNPGASAFTAAHDALCCKP